MWRCSFTRVTVEPLPRQDFLAARHLALGGPCRQERMSGIATWWLRCSEGEGKGLVGDRQACRKAGMQWVGSHWVGSK